MLVPCRHPVAFSVTDSSPEPAVDLCVLVKLPDV